MKQDSGSRETESGSKKQEFSSKKQVRIRILVSGRRSLVARSKQEAGVW